MRFRRKEKFEPPAREVKLLCQSVDMQIKGLVGIDRKDAILQKKMGIANDAQPQNAYRYYERADELIDWLLEVGKRTPDFISSRELMKNQKYRLLVMDIHARVNALSTKENFTEQRLIALKSIVGW